MVNELGGRPASDFSGVMYTKAWMYNPEAVYQGHTPPGCFTHDVNQTDFMFCPYALSGKQFLNAVGLHTDSILTVMAFLFTELVIFHALASWILVLKRPCFVKCRDPPSHMDREAAERQQAQDEAMAVGLFANAMNAQPVLAQEAPKTVPASVKS